MTLGLGLDQELRLRLSFSFSTHAVGPWVTNRVCVEEVATNIGSVRIGLSLTTGIRTKKGEEFLRVSIYLSM